MQTKPNDVWASSDNSTNISVLTDPASNIVVLDETSLKDVAGGAFLVPALYAVGYAAGRCAANPACALAVRTGVSFVLSKLTR